MRTMHPTLLIGPADWDRLRIPREEFTSRIDVLWHDHRHASGAIVYGDSFDHAALAYLTNFTPKLQASLALLPRQGESQLLVGGGVNMIDAAKPLTWIDHLLPLRDLGSAVSEWAQGLADAGRVLLIGGGAMPFRMRRNLDDALGKGINVEDATESLRTRIVRKGPHELAAIREACVCLNAAVATLFEVQESGAGVSACVLAAEHAAYHHGAQDVRSLFSLDHGSTLRPFDVVVEQAVDPLQVYLAVRHTGYWVEGFVRVSAAPDQLATKANSVLRTMISAAKPGMSCRDLTQIIEAERRPLRPHPMADRIFGNSIGLSLEEPPLLARDGEAVLAPSAVYSLRAGVIDAHGSGAIASAMLVLTEDGNEVIWSADEQP
jgi:Xaa-Pro aminopeptidase